MSDVLSNGVSSSGEEYIEVVAAPLYDDEYEVSSFWSIFLGIKLFNSQIV